MVIKKEAQKITLGFSKCLLYLISHYHQIIGKWVFFFFSRYFQLKSLMFMNCLFYIPWSDMLVIQKAPEKQRVQSAKNPATVYLSPQSYSSLHCSKWWHIYISDILRYCAQWCWLLCPMDLTKKLIATIITLVYSKVQPASFCCVSLLQRRGDKIILSECWFLFFPVSSESYNLKWTCAPHVTR